MLTLITGATGRVGSRYARHARWTTRGRGIVDTARIRAELGYRPLYPSVYAAQGAGAL